jgi:hypothetical protein
MNHHLHAKKPRARRPVEPAITIQRRSGHRIYANKVAIRNGVVRVGALRVATDHDVKAWIECDSADVEVLA